MSKKSPSEPIENLFRECISIASNYQGAVDLHAYKYYIATFFFLRKLSLLSQPHTPRQPIIPENISWTAGSGKKHSNIKLSTKVNFHSLLQPIHKSGISKQIDEALQQLTEDNVLLLGNMFENIKFSSSALGDEQQRDHILKQLLDLFSHRDLSNEFSPTHFCLLLSNFAFWSGKKDDGFYTPPEISQLISRLVTPIKGDTICDPACGTGSLLLSCNKQIQDDFGENATCSLYGQELVGPTWSLAKMNMILHGVADHQIEWGDTIRNPKLLDGENKLRLFDIAVSSLPFVIENWGGEAVQIDKFKRFTCGIPPSNRGAYAFILHMLKTLKGESGRMAIVVPHGALFRRGAEQQIRAQLIEDNLLDAVINLPEKLFYDNSKPRTILIFKKQKKDKKTLFIDASHDFLKDKILNTLRPQDLDKITSTYLFRKNVKGYSALVPPGDIISNDFNIMPHLYISTETNIQPESGLLDLHVKQANIREKLAQLDAEISHNLSSLLS